MAREKTAEKTSQEVELQEPEERGRVEKRRLSSPARVILILVVLAAVIDFVVQNRQTVKVHFLVITGHPRIVWLIVVSLVIGAIVEALLRRFVRLRVRARRKQFREEFRLGARRGTGRR